MLNSSRRLLQAGRRLVLSGVLGVFAAILPLLTGWLLRVPRVALDNFTDAVFYLSYARQFGELIARYGFPYYATRFGGILPDALSGALFGEVNGIWLLRWALSVVVSLSLFLFFRKRSGALSGVIASLLWSLNPAALRLLCTTYVDSTAVPFLILGCIIFAVGRGMIPLCLVAGILFGMAASAHLYAAIALLFLTPWLIGSQWEERKLLIRSVIWTVVGFFGTFLIGWLWYWAVWGMPALFSPTMEVMHDLGSGQTVLWKKPLVSALRDAPAWYAPFALVPALLLGAIRGSSLLRGAAIALLASVGFFWGGDLFGNAYVLSMPFYYSFLLPVMMLSSATLCGEVIVERGKQKALLLLTLIGIASGFLLVNATGMFSQMLGHYVANDLPVIELAGALRRELPLASQDGRVMRFWCDDDPTKPGGGDRRMIESFWLHPFGKLTGEKGRYLSFPQMSPADAEVLRFSGVDRIVIFDQESAIVDRGVEEITTQSLPFRVTKKLTLAAPSDRLRQITVAVLERKKPIEGKVTTIDIKDWKAYQGGQILACKTEGIDLLSGGVKGWGFANLPIGPMKKGERVEIHYRVESGMIRFALREAGDDLAVEQIEKWTTPELQVLTLTAPSEMKNALITLHSMYPRGSRSRVFIERASKY